MNDETRDPDPGDAALEARLAAYAAARLRPDRAATARSRARLVELATATIPAGGSGPIPITSRRGAGRRLMALGLAAALLLVLAGGALAGSGAGGPLYGVRLWLEDLTLPTEPGARTAAELERLERRLAAAEKAAAAGDATAAEAAIDAFSGLLADTIAAAEADPGTDAFVAARLAKHLEVLETLRDRLPAAALDGITNAIEKSGKAIDRLEDGAPGGPPGKPSEPPGQASTPPGQASTPPGQASTPPGKPSSPPGKPSPSP